MGIDLQNHSKNHTANIVCSKPRAKWLRLRPYITSYEICRLCYNFIRQDLVGQDNLLILFKSFLSTSVKLKYNKK